MLKKSNWIRFMAMGIVGALASSAGAATYVIDDSHTSIGFSVRHMVVTTVRGHFEKFSGSLEFDPESGALTSASAKVDVNSINTNNQRRDDHLRNPDFFDAANYPEITFETTRIEGDSPNLSLTGNLTMRGVTKEIQLPVELSGPITDPWGNERIGLAGSTEVNRQDFGISWSNTLDGGGLVVSDTVRLVIDVQAIKQ